MELGIDLTGQADCDFPPNEAELVGNTGSGPGKVGDPKGGNASS